MTLLAACSHLSTSESDSEPSDATSRIRFVQYQPATVTVIPLSNSDSTASPKGQESRRSEYFENTLNSPLRRQQERPAEQENQRQTYLNNVSCFQKMKFSTDIQVQL